MQRAQKFAAVHRDDTALMGAHRGESEYATGIATDEEISVGEKLRRRGRDRRRQAAIDRRWRTGVGRRCVRRRSMRIGRHVAVGRRVCIVRLLAIDRIAIDGRCATAARRDRETCRARRSDPTKIAATYFENVADVSIDRGHCGR